MDPAFTLIALIAILAAAGGCIGGLLGLLAGAVLKRAGKIDD